MKKYGWLRCIGITAAYWVACFIGPFVIALLNNVGYWFSGAGYDPDSFMYKILAFLSQPLSCGAAYFIAQSISDEEHPICVLANTIVGSCVTALFILTAATMQNRIVMAISTVVCIISAVTAGKELSPSKQRENV